MPDTSEKLDARPDDETVVAQAAGFADPATGAVVPTIQPSTTFKRLPDGSYPDGRAYARDESPDFGLPERILCELERGADAAVFSSGMAAAAAVLDALAPGSRIIAPRQMYFALRGELGRRADRGDFELVLVAAGDHAQLEEALAKPQPQGQILVWLETPANPTGEVTDLKAACSAARRFGALTAVDSTIATPLITKPLTYGADLVMHSATKALNGHSDLLAGALITREKTAYWAEVLERRHIGGAVLGSFESWLLVRGMRTLAVRVERMSQNALAIARFLEQHPRVSHVAYPGLESSPGHQIAKAQMQGGFGYMLSFCTGEDPHDETEIRTVANQLRLFHQATSLGGTESLAEHRFSIEGEASESPANLLRLSVGIEATADLIADLEQALH